MESLRRVPGEPIVSELIDRPRLCAAEVQVNERDDEDRRGTRASERAEVPAEAGTLSVEHSIEGRRPSDRRACEAKAVSADRLSGVPRHATEAADEDLERGGIMP